MREHQTIRCRVGSFVLQSTSVRSSVRATMTVFIVMQTVVAIVRMSNGFYRCIRGVFECPVGFVGASEACVPLFECPMGFVGASEACVPLFECPMGFVGASEACVPLFECPMGFVGASEVCVPLFECPVGFVGASEVCESSQSLERSACDWTGLLSAACPWLGCTSGTTRTRTMPTCPRWRHCRFDSTNTRSHCRRLIELVWSRQEITLPTTGAELV